MKRVIAALMTVLFLGTTGLVLADAVGGPAKAPKHHKKHHKGKANVALNPQPLPPAKIPVDGSSTGVNKNQ
ncbi:MAG TPA: hypothetical protein VK859_00670 [bacterium]|jgi:hypothetical protein|nr:hypothetical protein [bacterium]